MLKVKNWTSKIPPVNDEARTQAAERMNQLTKPPGSLGRLESLAIELAAVTGEPLPQCDPAAVLIMAADHGVTEEGISAYPPDVTAQMVYNFLRGGAAINALARQANAAVRVVDIGVASELEAESLRKRKVRPGTGNFAQTEAMTRDEVLSALQVGWEEAADLARSGTRLLAIGEMGIGNTTTSAALVAALTGCSPKEVVGRGTGLDDERLLHKTRVIEKALSLHSINPSDPIDVLSKVGGLEVAGLAGAVLGAASHRVPVVMDGYISTVAAWIATKIEPAVKPYLFASHLSVEPGHRIVLNEMDKTPLFALDMRLGEGSGAALAIPIFQAACRILREMATFAEAGVSGATHE
jgi:nicotinate-nucleotide--dimethylbenzimidazole phosphoribosyltransferase